MSVQEQTPFIEYECNGITKIFPLNFDCYDSDHLVVKLDDVNSLTNEWVLSGGSIVFHIAPKIGSKLSIQRNTPLERLTEYNSYDNSMRPPVFNDDFDRIWYKLQELGLADWLLGLKLEKEIQDRIAADIYYYTLVTSETDYKINELKEYLEALINNLSGGDFIPILDKYIKTWSGRTQEEKNRDSISPLDFGAKGNGVDNDTQAFVDLEKSVTDIYVDLLGRTYRVDEYPVKNKYFNGSFYTGVNVYEAEYCIPKIKSGVIALGASALANRTYNPLWTDSIVAIGNKAMSNMTDIRTSIAIGANALGKGTKSRDNIAIGDDALYETQARSSAYDQANKQGTRNIAIGGTAGRFIYEGFGNSVIGRGAGQCLRNGDYNVAFGVGALGGSAPVGLNGEIINPFPMDVSGAIAIGTDTLFDYKGADPLTAIGHNALSSARKLTTTVALGAHAGRLLDAEIASNGKTLLWSGTDTGTYTQTGTTLSLTFSNLRGAVVGCYIGIRLLDGAAQTLQGDIVPVLVQAISGNTITVSSPLSLSASGTAQFRYVYSTNDATSQNGGSVIVGSYSMNDSGRAYRTVSVGAYAAYSASCNSSTLMGYNVGRNSPSITFSTLIGNSSASGSGIYQACSALGSGTLMKYINGTAISGTLQNSTAIGADATVSANNQLQLGASGVTVYAYGAIQDRSDIRDKADIEEMPQAMTDFVLGLNAVQGVWDMRDDYVNELFPPLAPPTKESYPAKPEKPSSDAFVFTYDDGLIINRTDLYEEALKQYELELASYHQEVDRIDNEYAALKAGYERKSSERDAKVREWWSNPTKDGSKKRNRKHNWFIAQDVKSLADQLGIDFAGLQDHKLIDGTDTLTLGYEEFIPPIVHTLQRFNSRLKDIERKLGIAD